MLRALLPPGRLSTALDGILSAFLASSAEELERVDGRGQDLINESDPRTCSELLPDYERVFGLVATGTIDQRRARVVAAHIRRQRFRPVDFQQALAPLLLQDPEDVVVIERSHAFAASLGDQREIFRFFIYRNPSLPGTADIAGAQALVDAMNPSHTVGTVIQSISFLCDDPLSLCDRDALGV